MGLGPFRGIKELFGLQRFDHGFGGAPAAVVRLELGFRQVMSPSSDVEAGHDET